MPVPMGSDGVPKKQVQPGINRATRSASFLLLSSAAVRRPLLYPLQLVVSRVSGLGCVAVMACLSVARFAFAVPEHAKRT